MNLLFTIFELFTEKEILRVDKPPERVLEGKERFQWHPQYWE